MFVEMDSASDASGPRMLSLLTAPEGKNRGEVADHHFRSAKSLAVERGIQTRHAARRLLVLCLCRFDIAGGLGAKRRQYDFSLLKDSF